MCSLKALKIMSSIVGLLFKLNMKSLNYISMVETRKLKNTYSLLDGVDNQQEIIQISGEFYEMQTQVFLQILELIESKEVLDKATQYLSELTRIINIPNYRPMSLNSSLEIRIQHALIIAQSEGMSELWDKIVEYKSKTYRLNDISANI